MSSLPGTGGAPGSSAGSARSTRRERTRRALGHAVLHAPQTLRALVRADEIWLVVLAAFVGVVAGLLVVAMNEVTLLMHHLLFFIPMGDRLSSALHVPLPNRVIVPVLGGLGMGLFGLALARWHSRRAIDPIEANALYGGRMSTTDSLIVVAQTILSNGAGASIGLEAGYTQIGSAFGSRIGRAFRVRRNDLRLLVGCGSAGAIAAAFNAPLTGAFYAFELIIGTYSLATLAPVVVSAITAVVTMRMLIGGYAFDVRVPTGIEPVDYVPILALGMFAALIGILIMRGVTLTESLIRKSGVPPWLRTMLGGLCVGLLALASPQVLSSGHGALKVGLDAPYTTAHVGLLLVLKACASAISIGSGFRGGLFFASLFLGSLVGKLFAGLLAMVTTSALPPVVCGLVGMSALATAIVGGPLTMSFLALETTGSLPLTVAVLAAAVISSLTVRRTFGYSFATWRFHLRGEAIRSAVDVGWMRNLTVGRMMRRELRTVRADMSLAAFRREYPLGATQRVVAVDAADRYAGIVLIPDAHAEHEGADRVSGVLHYQRSVLLPQMTVKEAVAMFENAESDALAVVDGPETMKVIGVLTEQYALRRYSEELDRRRRELSGE